MNYPKRLIEVDLPIKRISAHARREKSIRHGHISTLHIWWARRPLAACRAVICAALWPDPADDHCPAEFRATAAKLMLDFARRVSTDHKLATEHCSPENFKLWQKLSSTSAFSLQPLALRSALLDFIADFANWDNSTVKEYLDTSRALTQAAHEALGGEKGTRPLVVDPFAGGGSIPLEALRIGADAFASDLNPVAVLLNKVVLEYIPKYGQRLADEVRKWGDWIKQEAEKELAEFYPRDPDGATPIAYLWARTIQCEGPGCGAEVPLIRSLWLAKKANRSVALQLVPRPQAKRVDFKIIVKQRGGWVDQDDPTTKLEDPKFDGTVKRGSATCPCCGYTTPVARVREQLKGRRGGANDARLFCVVASKVDGGDHKFRISSESDYRTRDAAHKRLAKQTDNSKFPIPEIPTEPTPLGGGSGAGRAFSQRNYGMDQFSDLFSSRMLLTLSSLARLIRLTAPKLKSAAPAEGMFANAVVTCLGFALNKCTDYWNSIAGWMPRGTVGHAFARQAIQITWDFVEANPIADFHCAWHEAYEWVAKVCEQVASSNLRSGQAEQGSAQKSALPTDSAECLFTDPPYYDAVPYADLSDFFGVWLRRAVGDVYPDLLGQLSPKDDECILDDAKGKDRAFFEKTMTLALAEGRRYVKPDGIGLVVFAHKSTAGWEAQLQSMMNAGWTVTGSWPIDTERGARLRAMDSAALASSVHLVCRPRENPDGSVRTEDVGDWRDVLAELPRRIHEWMPRLADEGVVGADAIFACLGPALEIFSRYSRVEKASGETVPLKEYLEQVWAAVAKEALAMIFHGADTTGFEEDARLTAMWLWTLKTHAEGETLKAEGESESEEEDEDGRKAKGQVKAGFVLEYDAARKIAQGLGAHLEGLTSLVEVTGETARLLPVAERARALFGKEEGKEGKAEGRKLKAKGKSPQLDLFAAVEGEASADGQSKSDYALDVSPSALGETILDRIHQSMILFGAGRGEALKRFLVEDGAGNDQRFWRLAQALSALYPAGTEEKRWVDGVLARKKGLGF